MDSSNIVHHLVRGESSGTEASSQSMAAGMGGAVHYPFTDSSSYELTVTAASNLNVPVLGTVSGGASRRVVVVERRSYRKSISEEGIEFLGYTIRLAVTVNRLNAGAKLSLPFLAASAEIGQIEGRWAVQVVGLVGPEIDKAIIPPAELSVEQYVKAKDSLKALIDALNDPNTKIEEQRIYFEPSVDKEQQRVDLCLGRAYALSSLDKRWKLQKTLAEVVGARQALLDAVIETYNSVAGIQGELDEVSAVAQAEARRLLGQIRDVNPR